MNNVSICKFPCNISNGEAYFMNGSCAECKPPMLLRSYKEESYCDFPCNAGSYYFEFNQSCSNFCPNDLGFIQRTSSIYSFCDFVCKKDEYFHTHNNSCNPTCPPLLLFKNQSNYLFCLPRCPPDMYYFEASNSCLQICPEIDHFEARNESGFLFCDEPCNSGEFLDENSTCVTNCNFPFVNSTKNGIKLCHAPCSAGEYLYPNRSCISSCKFPYINISIGTIKICSHPCQSEEFYYFNNSCQPLCPQPFVSSMIDEILVCSFPCKIDEFYYSNQTCRSICPGPFLNLSINEVLICKTPCNQGEFYFANNTCSSQCPNPYLISKVEEIFYCKNPCIKNGTFLYWNQSCHPQCPKPFLSYNESNDYMCKHPCEFIYPKLDSSQYDTYYILPNGSCTTNCSLPYVLSRKSGINYCLIPQKSQIMQALESTVVVVSSTMGIASITTLLTQSNPAMLWSLITLIQYFFYLLFLNLDFPSNLKDFLKLFSFATFDFFPNVFNLMKLPVLDSPPKFMDQGYQGLFLSSTGRTLGLMLILAEIFLIFKKFEKKNKVIRYIYGLLIQFFPYKFLISIAPNFIIASLLQLRTINFTSILFACSSIVAIFVLLTVLKFIQMIHKILKEKRNTKMTMYLFEGSNVESGRRYLSLIGLIKQLIFVTSLVIFYYLPFHQVAIRFTLNLVYLMILIMPRYYVKDPFSAETLKNIVKEVLFLLINFLLSFFFYDFDDGNKEGIGFAILIIMIFVIFVDVSFIVRQQYNVIKSFLEKRKLKKQQAVKMRSVKRKTKRIRRPIKHKSLIIIL